MTEKLLKEWNWCNHHYEVYKDNARYYYYKDGECYADERIGKMSGDCDAVEWFRKFHSLPRGEVLL